MEIKCTRRQLETIRAALTLEYERNYGRDTEAQALLKDALEVVEAALKQSA